ncbi:hypothetical protein GRI58_15170 [Porphyrobacter algicida]|uniref:Uncharacterized protein n=1 Tax=Qipengyuania algicida TaxID=1836209 RepID=A0A845AKZ6_9SPHN|nr:hypothetical protein [Qipengyuania algicida]MXP30149.1 hypothetical protein [Qipengyuania algicida]
MGIFALFLLAGSAGAASEGPTPAEFAKALSEHVGVHVEADDLHRLSCKGFGADEPTEAECRWLQRVRGKWKRYSTYVAVDDRGWHLIDEPNTEH